MKSCEVSTAASAEEIQNHNTNLTQLMDTVYFGPDVEVDDSARLETEEEQVEVAPERVSGPQGVSEDEYLNAFLGKKSEEGWYSGQSRR